MVRKVAAAAAALLSYAADAFAPPTQHVAKVHCKNGRQSFVQKSLHATIDEVSSGNRQGRVDGNEVPNSEVSRVGFSVHLRNLVRSERSPPRRRDNRPNGRYRRHGGGVDRQQFQPTPDLALLADEELKRMERLWYGVGVISEGHQEDVDGVRVEIGGDSSVVPHDPHEDEARLLWRGPFTQPDVYAYAVVADAYAKAGMGRRGAFLAEGVLHRLERIWAEQGGGDGFQATCGGTKESSSMHGSVNLLPNTVLYSSVINGWNRCGDGKRAEAVLERMEGMYEKSGQDPTVAPDSISFSSVIDAWGNSRVMDGDRSNNAVAHVDRLILRIEDLYKSGSNPNAKPNVYVYTAAMKAYTNHLPGVEGAKRAEALLRDMNKLYEQTGDATFKPNAHSYATCMNGWSKSGGGIEAAERAEALLNELVRRYTESGERDRSLMPSTAAYTCCIHAWSQSEGGSFAAQKAMKLLKRMEDGRAGPNVRPNTKTFTAVINAVANSEDPDFAHQAEQLLHRMDEPDSLAYSCVIHALARSDMEGSALQADNLLQQTHEISRRRSEDRPRFWRPADEATHAAVIHSYYKAPSAKEQKMAAQRADAVLRQLVELRRSGKSRSRSEVDVWVFNDAMSLWAKSGEVEAPYRCMEIHDMMEETSGSGYELSSPNGVSYVIAVDAWVRSNSPEAGKKAMDLLRRNEERSQKYRSCDPPNARMISSTLEAVLHGRGKAASHTAEELLRRMIVMNEGGDNSHNVDCRAFTKVMNFILRNDHDGAASRVLNLFDVLCGLGTNETKLNTVVYNVIINCMAKSRETWAAKKAEELLDSMEQLYKEGNDEVKPDIITYGAVINALAKSGFEDASDKAESLLGRLEEMHRNGDEKMKPNSFIYNGVISALANNSNRSSADRAERILEQMEQKYLNGDNEEAPSLKTYTSVILAHAHSRGKNAGEKAENILSRLERAAKAGGDDALLPDMVLYASVLNCYSKSTQLGSRKKAEDLLSHMLELYEAGRENLKPNTKIFSTVINALASSRDPHKAEKCLNLLRRMQQMAEAGNASVAPDVFSYTWVIHAAATSVGDEDERKHFFAIALEMFKEVHATKGLVPDSYVYAFFVKACLKLLPSGEERDGLVRGAFELSCKHEQVNKYVVTIVRRALPDYLAERFLEEGKDRVDFNDIPLAWCCHASGVNHHEMESDSDGVANK